MHRFALAMAGMWLAISVQPGFASSHVTTPDNDQVTKPIDPVLLYDALARWLDTRVASAHGSVPAARLHDGDTEMAAAPAMIDGVDVAAGLRRSAGNLSLYHKLLRQFARDHRDAGETLRRAIDGNDLPAARALAHTVKGVAGNLGALEVQTSAATVEAAARDGETSEAAAALPALAIAMNAVTWAIEDALGDEPDEIPAPAAGSVDAASLDAEVQQLLGLLDSFDADAVERFDTVRAGLSQLLGQDTCEALRRAMDGFEFGEAAELLRNAWGEVS